MKTNYCIVCEEEVEFKNGKCKQCDGKYDDVVPASCRKDYEFDLQKERG